MRDQLNKGENLLTPLKQKKHSFFQGGETKRMKTRKIMASLLAFAMLLSIVAVPVGSADAASTNTVDRVPQVADDQVFSLSTNPDHMKPVYLRIEEKNNDFKDDGNTPAEEVIILKLQNAEFLLGNTAAENFVDTVNGQTYIKDAEAISDTEVKLTLVSNLTNKQVWEIPLLSKVTDSGEVAVVIDGRGGFVSSGTLTYAVAADGGSVTSVGKVVKFSDPRIQLNTIVVDETRAGSLAKTGSQKITLRLPANFEWKLDQEAGEDAFEVTHSSGVNLTPTAANIDNAENVLTLTLNNIPKDSKGRGTIYFKGLKVLATSDAKFGEVDLTISGGEFTRQSLVVAEYRDYGVIIEGKDSKKEVPELFAGRMKGTGTEEEHELKTLVIKENSKNAWMTERRTRIEFPAGVKIMRVVGDKAKELNAGSFSKVITDDGMGKNYIEYSGIKKNANYATNSGKAEIELTFYVSIAADFKGDITATVSGNALTGDKTEVVLGKALVPATVEADSVDLRIGVLNQPVGDIIITETKEEAIMKDDIVVYLGRDTDRFTWNNIPKVEVIEGDIVLDTKAVKKDGRELIIPVKTISSKPSKIKISGGYADLDRTIPEGAFNVSIGGKALVENYSKNPSKNNTNPDEHFHKVEHVASIAALNVVTPAPGEQRKTVKFNLDSKEYVVIEAGKEVTKTMDVAPYNENGRALLPLRFVAEALGVSEDNIVWNANTKEVTIFKGDRVAKVAIGSNVLVVNGTNVVMDTTAAIKDERTVLPIRFVGQALGANIGWDEATRTITVQQ